MGAPRALHRLVLVLCRYDERGQGQIYREQGSVCLFRSVEAWTAWVKERALSGKFYAYPLRNPTAQLDHLRLFQKDGIAGVLYDPPSPDSAPVPIDELISRMEAEAQRAL